MTPQQLLFSRLGCRTPPVHPAVSSDLCLALCGSQAALVQNWPQNDVHAIVVTDGSRILGLGDLGLNGLGIPIGKLDLYCAGGGECLVFTVALHHSLHAAATVMATKLWREMWTIVQRLLAACVVQVRRLYQLQLTHHAKALVLEHHPTTALRLLTAGFNPTKVLPCVIDVGTDNAALRNDPLYVGLNQPRLDGPAYYEIMDEVGVT